jgi:hypothetical protein
MGTSVLVSAHTVLYKVITNQPTNQPSNQVSNIAYYAFLAWCVCIKRTYGWLCLPVRPKMYGYRISENTKHWNGNYLYGVK